MSLPLRAAGLAALLCAAPTLAAAKPQRPAQRIQKRSPPKAKKGKRTREPPGPPLPPPALDLLAVDLGAGQVIVGVAGSARSPEARLFTLTDERDRRYLPSLVDCQPQPPAEATQGSLSAMAGGSVAARPSGRWRCTLEVPRIYQRHALVGLSVTLRGQTMAVPRERVQAAWAEARAAVPLPPAERPRQPGVPWPAARRPDAGPVQDPDEVDSETED